tara:strand:+ start:175 stop:2199 length:2025 start_codon:yes stop_codon:yes gene_type:complete
MWQNLILKKTTSPIKIALLLATLICGKGVKAQSNPDMTNLGSIINSDQIEYAPSISADGNTMIYQSNKEGNYELFMAHRNASGVWSSSEVIESIKNFGSDDVLIAGSSLSYDGNYIYFFASYPGGYGIEDIWYVEKEGESWSNPINAGPNVNSNSYEGFPSISADGSTIYFMRTVKSPYPGKFCYKLFSSEKDNRGQWKLAQPLPYPVSQGCENCPRIMSDNETLIFAAIREPSDNYEIYQSRNLGNGKWSNPVAYDFINTPSDDKYGTIPSSGDIMYLNRDFGNGHDIYSISIPLELRPRKVVNIQGVLKDCSTDKPIEARIAIFENGKSMGTSGLKSNAFDGNFTVVLKTGASYEIKIAPKGYVPYSVVYDLTETREYGLINKDICIKPFRIHQHVYPLVEGDTTIASIFVDDVVLRDTTNMFIVKASSEYEIRIEKEGYKTIKQTLRIPADTRTAHLHKSFKLIATKPQLTLRVVNNLDSLIKGSLLQLFDGKIRKVVYQGKLEEGLYNMELEYDRKYMYKALASRHFYYQGIIDLTGINYGKIINEDAVLTPIEVGAKITINSILFETASAELTENDKNELKNVINVLAQNRNIILEISAHTDDIGSDGDNLKLSEARAKSVMDHLVSQKVPARMLTSKGYGESQPVVPNTSEESRALNRRVEFRVNAVK